MECGVGTSRRRSCRALCAATPALLARGSPASHIVHAAGPPPAVGDVVSTEHTSDTDANGNDFIELLVLRDNRDLRGLRITENELQASGLLIINESVLVFGSDDFLASVPGGTTIAVWMLATGMTTDTVV